MSFPYWEFWNGPQQKIVLAHTQALEHLWQQFSRDIILNGTPRPKKNILPFAGFGKADFYKSVGRETLLHLLIRARCANFSQDKMPLSGHNSLTFSRHQPREGRQ